MELASEKRLSTSGTGLARQSNEQFQQALHADKYDDLPQVLYLLTAAYLENPNDAAIAADLGFAHIWRLSERQRLTSIPATITDDIVLARKYFGEAVQLNPGDPRLLGFYGVSMMAEGRIDKNEKLSTQGYFIGRRAIGQWPEFNYFTVGYVLSGDPYDSQMFRDALEWQWRTLDLCYGKAIDRGSTGTDK